MYYLLIGDKMKPGNEMNHVNELFVQKYGHIYTTLNELFGEELSQHLVQLWGSDLDMKIASAYEEYETAAIHRDTAKKQVKEIILYLKEHYLTTPPGSDKLRLIN